MKIVCLGNNSHGNCYYVKFDSGEAVILDAGVDPKSLIDRSLSMTETLVLVTHEHSDHSKYARQMRNKYGAEVGVSQGTEAVIKADYILKPNVWRDLGGLSIVPFPVIHEGINPVGYYVTDGDEGLLYITDAGVVPDHLMDDVDVLIIEANYTQSALQSDDVSPYVVGRVSSGFGHLSARQASEFSEYYMDRLDLLLITHVSGSNFDMDDYLQDKEISQSFKDMAIFTEVGGEYNSLPF